VAPIDTEGADRRGTLDLLKETCREAVAELDAAAALFSRVIGDLLLELAEHTRSGRTLHLGHEYLISDYPLTHEVIANCESRTVSMLDPDPDPKEAELLAELGFESLLMVPVFVNDVCWRLLEVYGVAGRRFDDADARRAEEIVARTAARLGAAP
jgi:GAF domain-containing protein